jgi:hypothetical protein
MIVVLAHGECRETVAVSKNRRAARFSEKVSAPGS